MRSLDTRNTLLVLGLLAACGCAKKDHHALRNDADAAGSGGNQGVGGKGAAGSAVSQAGTGTAGKPSAAAGHGGGTAGAPSNAGHGGGGSGTAGDEPIVAGTTVALSLPSDAAAQLSALSTQLDGFKDLTTAQLLAKHQPKQTTALGYDPSLATGLDAIQASSLKLDASELARLKERGFVVSTRQQFPHMLYGYDTIYAADLPVYVSADSILDAVHRSYDLMLETVEDNTLVPELSALLDGMRSALAARTGMDAARADADFFLAVAKSLLEAKMAAPVAGAKADEIASFVKQATAGSGHERRQIFGLQRDIDFSQFTPRGHYTDSEELKQYFRAMMWFGRIDLRLIETNPDGSQAFHRDQLETAVLLRELLDASLLAHWQRVDTTIETFVGKSDYMRIPEVDTLLSDLGIKSGAELAGVSDQKIAQAIVDGGYGTQLIASQLIVNETSDGKTLPLDRSFALFGQRYTVDSHVFSNVVYDRVPDRLMPNPLDAAFAALGNDQAAQLLKPELETYTYAPALESMRALIDAHGDAYWNQDLYTLWLGSLRTLSPTADLADPKAAGLPGVAATETWGRRVLNTQLASWAELRHDTILYVKQSYTGGNTCVFPDAYVDPYPEFYAALARFADHGSALADTLAGGMSPDLAQAFRLYFDHLHSTMTTLGGMADYQRKGTPFAADQMAFINQAVREDPQHVCGAPPQYTGWYAELIYGALPSGKAATEFKPTIADVHTQPTDAGGNDVGRILHVGTGYARLMVVTTDSCDGGAKAYAGLALSYYEKITENYERLTDEQWQTTVQASPPPADVPWAADFLAGAQ